MLRDPVVQNTRLMPTPETEEEGVGSHEGEESENPLVGPGITITQPDKIQPIKVPVPLVHVTCHSIHNLHDNNNTISWVLFLPQFGNKKNGNSQDASASEVHIHRPLQCLSHLSNQERIMIMISLCAPDPTYKINFFFFSALFRVIVIKLDLASPMTSQLTTRRWTRRRRMTNRWFESTYLPTK